MTKTHFSGESGFQGCVPAQDQPCVEESIDRMEDQAQAPPEATTFPDEVVDGHRT